MTIRELRILPPFAIGRLGSAAEPLDNYTIEGDRENPLGFRKIVGAPTLVVDETSGEIRERRVSKEVTFKQGGCIRPVAPFLEVFAVVGEDHLEPLTLDLLHRNGLKQTDVSWRTRVANRKIFRRTDDPKDVVSATTDWFSNHAPHRLLGGCRNFISDDSFIDFGHVRYIKPNDKFPEIRLRFTPAKGLIYGPHVTAENPPDPVIVGSRAIYDSSKGSWYRFGDDDAEDGKASSETAPASQEEEEGDFFNDTLPPALYAIKPPAPSWLNHNIAISRGYLDDACDGFVEVRLTVAGRELKAQARICAGPPAVVPDSLFVRNLADDLDQVLLGPTVPDDEPEEETRARAAEIVRRAYETVRFMNVAVMNGNDFKGRSALSLDSMPEEEAADTQRPIRPVMSPATVDTRAILALHEQVYAALQGRAAPWFLRLLRRPEEVADFTDRGRRKMPALMCGADNNYLALTWRQIDTIRKAGEEALFAPAAIGLPRAPPVLAATSFPPAGLTPRNLSAQIHYAAAGNPVSSRPEAAVANCCPGLEVDFRAVWRRMFKGLVLREWDSLVVDVEPDAEPEIQELKGHRMLRVFLPDETDGIPVFTQFEGPASSDPDGKIVLTTNKNPAGLAPLEWSNALARVLSEHNGRLVRCEFTRDAVWSLEKVPDPLKDPITFRFEVRAFFDGDTAVISPDLADAGELTQGLCSPWQNDYRECSCYYWASARPDFVNVEPTTTGLSKGDNWLQKERTGDYVPDDYSDTRLIHYDDLFLHWEKLLRFQVGGRDVPEDGPRRDTGEAQS
jgi:hypothetical protein